VDSGCTVSYSYDYLARLLSAVTNGDTAYPRWGLSFSYDRYGNRTQQTVTAGSAPSNSVTIDSMTNRISGSPYAYDADGNMTNDGLNSSMVYDAENRLVTINSGSATYSYDGRSLRVKKVAGGTTTAYIFSGTRAIAEYQNGAAPSSPTREYIYSGASLLAKIESGAVEYYHPDQLSVRLMTDSSGNVIGQQAHYPFGEQWYAQDTTTKWFFTSYERDSESGNDYSTFRYNTNRFGRFGSPDLLAGSVGDPQSLNRYAYVRGDPVNLVDPLGLDCNWWENGDTPWCNGGEVVDTPAYPSNPGFCNLDGECGDGGGYPGASGSYSVSCVVETVAGVEGNPTQQVVCAETIPVGSPSGPTDPAPPDPIKKALQKLKDLLKLDKKCADFLSAGKYDPVNLVQQLLASNQVGQALIAPTQNANGSTTVINAATGYTPGEAITVNTVGAFFNSSYQGMSLTTDRGRLRGGTDPAQGFILLHELGHVTGTLVPDASSQKLVDQNDKALEKNCAQTIKALGK
jgi:RHS repeat-associated protein